MERKRVNRWCDAWWGARWLNTNLKIPSYSKGLHSDRRWERPAREEFFLVKDKVEEAIYKEKGNLGNSETGAFFISTATRPEIPIRWSTQRMIKELGQIPV